MKKFNVAYKGREFIVKAKDEKSAIKGVVRKVKDSEWKPLGEIAQEVRQTIKEKWGLSNRQCYVRCSSFSGGRAVDIIVGADVPMDTYREIQRWARGGYEEIARDEFGEILSGGNTYIMVMKKDENGSNTMYGMDKKTVKDADKYHNSDLYKIYNALDTEGLHFVVDNNLFEFDSREEALKGWTIIKKCLEGTEHDCDFWSPFYVKINIDENFITDSKKVKDNKGVKYVDKNGKEIYITTDYGSGYQVAGYDMFGDFNPWQKMITHNEPWGDDTINVVEGYKTLDFDTFEEALAFAEEKYGTLTKVSDSKKIKDGGYVDIWFKPHQFDEAYWFLDEVEQYVNNEGRYEFEDLSFHWEPSQNKYNNNVREVELYGKESDVEKLFEKFPRLKEAQVLRKMYDKKSVKDDKPNLLGNYNWEWDEVAGDWYDTISKNYYLDIVKNSTLPNPAFLDKKSVKDYGGLYTSYDNWLPEDIELHKNTDWGARDYRELPVEGDSFNYNVKLYSMNGNKEDNARFIKYIRPNPIFPPYYAPAPEYSYSDYLGPMFDGETHGAYDIHNRYETQDLYNLLSDSKPKKLRNRDKKKVKDSDTLDFKGIVERIEAFKKKNPNIDKISPYKAMTGLNEYTKFSYALYLAYEQLKGVPYFDRVQQAYYRAMNDKKTKYSRYLGGK